jgi:hypothetical protein
LKAQSQAAHTLRVKSDGVNMNTNVRELRGEPCVFVSDTKADLLASMISHLKASGKTGVLRVVK